MSKARELAELGAVYDSGALANRNLIINGGMQCWQRATSATAAANNYNTVDRFQIYEATDGAFTTQQGTGNSEDTGHENALQANVTTADGTIGSTQYAAIVHRIEAQNLQHLKWGYASGKNLVLSFWVKSNKTGIYSLSTEKNDATTYRRVNEFTIDAANTWEQKTIKIPALTNSNSGGTIANDSNLGIKFEWCLAYGSTFTTTSLDQWITTGHFASTNQVNWMDSTSNNFYLTGIQFELGDAPTPFEHRSFGQELALCSRYFQAYTGETQEWVYNESNLATGKWWQLIFPNGEMRTSPTVSFGSGWLGGTLAGQGSNTIDSMSCSSSNNRTSCRVTMSGTGGTAYNLVHTDGFDTRKCFMDAEL